MAIHTYLANLLFGFLDNIYYKNLKSVYKKDLPLIFRYSNIAIIKPEYFIYANYYFIYLFFHYMVPNNFLIYSSLLHINYINDLLYDNMLLNYTYVPENDVVFLKQTEKILFQYLFFFKIYFSEINSLNKFYIIFLQNLFYFLVQIHDIYKQRLLSIERKNSKKDENNEKNEKREKYENMNKNILKLFIVSPDKKIIENIAYSFRFATYSNYLFFLNMIIYLFLE
jgi:hypothetical protein